jgi:hypothetical protein
LLGELDRLVRRRLSAERIDDLKADLRELLALGPDR